MVYHSDFDATFADEECMPENAQKQVFSAVKLPSIFFSNF